MKTQSHLSKIISDHSVMPDSEYKCPICGKVIPPKRFEMFGRTNYVQPKCKCVTEKFQNELQRLVDHEKQERIKKYFNFSTIGERFDSYTFQNFKQREGSEEAFEAAQKFAFDFEKRETGLFIYGSPGNGKTHLAAAIAHTIKERGHTVVFQTVPKLLERIRATFNGKNRESEQEIMDVLTTAKLLVLDDIGAEKVSGWVLEVIFRIIDGRYQRKLKTIITSNLKPTDLEKHLIERPDDPNAVMKAARLIDRILEISEVKHNKATSYRREIALQRARGEKT